MKQEDTRRVGQAVMAGAGLSVFLFLLGVARRSYAVLAIPVFAGLTAAAGLAFWVGYTMATTNWDNPDDFGVELTDGDGHVEDAPTGAGDSTS
jgi:hypothetical protein